MYFPEVNENPASDHQPAASDLRGIETILLVEDEMAVREIESGVLQQSGYTVLNATSPQDALELCLDHKDSIHLLITDVVMPGMNGPTLAKQIAALRPGIKILYVSGYTNDALTHHELLDPNVFFLEKPFAPSTFLRKVREVLDSTPACIGNDKT